MTPEDKARIKKAYRERAIAVEAVLPKRSFADPRITALQAENEKLRELLGEAESRFKLVAGTSSLSDDGRTMADFILKGDA